jgi:hypothetical protein
MTNNVIAEVVWPGLRGSCRSISRGHSDSGIRLVWSHLQLEENLHNDENSNED